jgi:TonB-linked SusC/RagA family outer membrane protein
MKLTVLIFLGFVLGVSGSTYSQSTRLTLDHRNITIKELLNQIEEKSDFVFLYKIAELDENRKVSLSLTNASIQEILNVVLKDQNLTYDIYDRQVIIRKANQENKSTFNQQPKSITGKVTDSSGDPLPGVTVLIKGTVTGTITGQDGRYTLGNVPPNSVIIFSFVGMKNHEASVPDKSSVINVTMEEETIGIEEVVAVGYGSMRKSDLTGAVSSVTVKDADKLSVSTMDLALQGKALGVVITNTSSEPGGNASIRIRGSNSISSDNEPLIVLDGYPLTREGEASGNGFGQGLNPLTGINPSDIESVQVLKDASATAIYGARGANGVMIITTKRGRTGEANIQFDTNLGISEIINLPEMGTAQQYAQMWNDYDSKYGNPPRYDGSSPTKPTPEEAGIGTRWVEEILRTSITHKHQLTINGGTSKVRYNISGDFSTDNGVVKGSQMQRGILRVNLDNQITDKLSVSTTINLTNTKHNRIQPGSAQVSRLSDPVTLALRANPIIPVDADGTGIWGGDSFGDADGMYFENPLTLIKDKKDDIESQDYFASVKGVYKFTPELSLTTNTGTTRRNNERNIYYPKTTALGFQNSGYAFANKYTSVDYIFEAYLQYAKTFNKIHRVHLMAGTSYQSNTRTTFNITASSFPNDILGVEGIRFATAINTPSINKQKRLLNSYYARFNYNLAERYIFTFTGRADGSSVFAENNKWGFFPSGAFAWRLSQEPFFPKNDLVSDVKMRVSYGVTGSQAISPLGSQAQISSTNYNEGDRLISGASVLTVGNDNLRWESTKQLNTGIDIGIVKNIVRLTFDYYQKTTEDLLQTLQIPGSTGYTSILTNMGSVRNRGFEVEVTANLFSKNKVNWTTGVNVSFNRSKVLDMGLNDIIYGMGSSTAPVFFRSTPLTIIQEGQPFPMYYGLKAVRLIQESDFDQNGNPTFATFNGEKNPGQWLYEDTYEDGIINALDRQIIGNPNPKASFGFNNDLSYKNLSLSIFIQGVVGNDLMNLSKAYLSTGMVNLNKYADWFENHWTPENPTNDLDHTDIGTLQNNLVPGNYYIEDASYVRLKNITLAYSLPHVMKSVFKNIVLTASCNNVLTITNYSGLDPEVGIFDSNLLPGIDLGSYPRARSYYFGIKFNFK